MSDNKPTIIISQDNKTDYMPIIAIINCNNIEIKFVFEFDLNSYIPQLKQLLNHEISEIMINSNNGNYFIAIENNKMVFDWVPYGQDKKIYITNSINIEHGFILIKKIIEYLT